MSSLSVAARALRDALTGFKPSLLSGEDCAAAAEELARGSEMGLVGLAKRQSLTVLRDEAGKRGLAAGGPEELHRRQRAARSVRWWRDELGMVRLDAALTPEVGVPLINRLEAETD